MYSNCLLWLIPAYRRAIIEWMRAGMPEGREPYIVIRPSRKKPRWVPHFLLGFHHSADRTIDLTSFKPVEPVDVPWWRVFLHFWFKGHVVKGD